MKPPYRIGELARLPRTLYERLRQSKFGKHLLILAGGSMVGRAINAVTSPILSRLYSPTDFGIRAVFISVLTVLVVVCALNYEGAIPLPKEDDSGADVMSLAFVLLAVNSMLCIIAVTFFAAPICRLLGAPQLQPYLWLLPIGVAAGGTFFIFNSWATRVQAFLVLSKRRVQQTIIQVAVQCSAPIVTRGPLGLVVGDCVGRIGSSLLFTRDVRADFSNRKARFSLRRIRQAALRYKRFPMFGLGAMLLHAGLFALPSLLLARFFTLQIAGWFSLVSQLLGVTLNLFGQSIAQVYLSDAARLAHSSPQRMRSLFLKTGRLGLFIGFVPLGILAIAGPKLFAIVFGARWAESGTYGQILALPYLVVLAVGPVFPTLTVLEHQDWQLYADGLGVAVMALGIWHARHAGLSGRWAVAAYGLAILVTYATLYALAFYAMHLHRKSLAQRENQAL